MSKGELLDWLKEKLAAAEKSLRAREQMESTWRLGSNKAWKKAGCKLTKKERIKESDLQGRIVIKCRREVDMFKAAIEAIK